MLANDLPSNDTHIALILWWYACEGTLQNAGCSPPNIWGNLDPVNAGAKGSCKQ
jgi:hypothetical protein